MQRRRAPTNGRRGIATTGGRPPTREAVNQPTKAPARATIAAGRSYRLVNLRDDVIVAAPAAMPATLDPEPMRTVIRGGAFGYGTTPRFRGSSSAGDAIARRQPHGRGRGRIGERDPAADPFEQGDEVTQFALRSGTAASETGCPGFTRLWVWTSRQCRRHCRVGTADGEGIPLDTHRSIAKP